MVAWSEGVGRPGCGTGAPARRDPAPPHRAIAPPSEPVSLPLNPAMAGMRRSAVPSRLIPPPEGRARKVPPMRLLIQLPQRLRHWLRYRPERRYMRGKAR